MKSHLGSSLLRQRPVELREGVLVGAAEKVEGAVGSRKGGQVDAHEEHVPDLLGEHAALVRLTGGGVLPRQVVR